MASVVVWLSFGALADPGFGQSFPDPATTLLSQNDENAPPELQPIGAQSVTEGDSLQSVVLATDPDAVPPSLSAEDVPLNASFFDSGNGSGGFFFAPQYTQAGDYDVRFIASDGLLADTELVTITVEEAGNQPPVLAPVGAQSVIEGQVLAVQLSGSDPDGTTPVLTAENLPVRSSFSDNEDGTGSFSFNPDYTQAAFYEIRFIAFDGQLADTEIVPVTVEEAGNQPPVLAALGPQVVAEEQQLTFTVSAADPDNTIPTLLAEDLPQNAMFDDNGDGTGVFDFTGDYTQAGDHFVRFVAFDGSLADTETVTITVTNVDRPPILGPIGPWTVPEGQLLNVGVSAADPDGDIPALNAENTPANASFTDHQNGTGTFAFAPDYAQAAAYDVLVVAQSSGLADSETVAVTVENVNLAPLLGSIGPHSVIEGDTLTFNVAATDPDGAIPLLTVENTPSHATFTDQGDGTGAFRFVPDFSQAAVYGLRFLASDGSLADTELVVITVEEAGNHAPGFAFVGPQTVTEGQLLSFNVAAADLDLSFPILTAEDVPANASFVDHLDGTGTFEFTPVYTQSGSYPIRFLASDGLLADTLTVPVVVEDAHGGDAGFVIPAAAWSRAIGDVPVGTRSNDPNRGVALGGFGAGTFMYNISGSFGPWGDEVGAFNPTRLKGAAFHVYERVGAELRVKCLTTDTVARPAWDRIAVGQGTYYALTPQGWCVYEGFTTEIASHFFSPIIAHNYRETSYPVAIWQFSLSNPTAQSADVAVMLTWPNPPFNRGKRIRTGLTNTPVVAGGKAGVVLKAGHPANAPETKNSEWCLAAKAENDLVISYGSWDPSGDGSDVWGDFSTDGVLGYEFDLNDSAAAIAVKVTLPPGGSRVIPLALAWDFPVVEFSGALGGPRSTQWWKRYCEYFDTLSDNSFAIAARALDSCASWWAQVDGWMLPFVDDVRYPTWLVRAAFNELYYNQFGGIFWESGLRSGYPEEYLGLHPEDHKNFDMESMVYTLSGNLSVGHYNSIVYARFWPEMERDLLRCHADIILYHDKCNPSVPYQAAPEIGTPVDYLPYDTCSIGDPFFVVDPHGYQSRPPPCASGLIHVQTETSSKFIQRCWRYYALYQDQQFLEYVWPAIESTYQFMKTYDCESEPKDSLPDVQGYDNTYDGWAMYGTDVYSGGLWVGALQAMDTMAVILGKPVRTEIQAWLEAARRNLDQQLWDPQGQYYHLDTDSPYPQAVFADALAGQRYCEAYGLPDILPRWKMTAHLEKVFDVCVAPNTDRGARLGRLPDGSIVPTNDRDTKEYWVGTTYYVAAMMYHAGLTQQALTTAFGAYWPVWESTQSAFWFNTPEAWSDLFYPRPGTIIPPPGAAAKESEPGVAPGEAPVRSTEALWPDTDPHQYQRPRAVWELMFEMQEAPPPPPILLRPQHFAFVVDSTPTFRWSRSLGPGGSYILQYARDSGFTTDLRTRTAIADTFFVTPEGEPLGNGTWYWRVQAVDKSGKSSGFTDPPFLFTVNAGQVCECDLLGDCNDDQLINPVDVVQMVRFVYQSGDPPLALPDCPAMNGDWTCDDLVNPIDVVKIVNYVYKTQTTGPCNPCD